MLNEFKRPMWNDGPAKQPWLNYFNEYERTHCCFGDDDNPDESENGVERGELGDFNVDPGYNPDTSMNQVDGGFVSDAGTSFTTDPTTGELNVDASGRVGPDGTVGIEGELGYNDLADIGYFDAVQADIQARDQKIADDIVADQSALERDVNVTVDKDGNYTYTGPDKYSAFAGEVGKAAMELSPTVQLSKAIAEQGGIGSVLGKAKDDLVSVFSGSPSAKQTSPSMSNSQASLSGLQSLGFNKDMASGFGNRGEAIGYGMLEDKIQTIVDLIEYLEDRRETKKAIESDVDIDPNRRARGGMVYRNEGGGVEEKTKSAMELYLEKLGQPSKYTVPMVPMNTPSMAPPPDTSDPFALAEYRKNLARETMGSYLPYDPAGASSAINTFNENYYGGASNVNPYNVAQLASLYGLPRDAATYEGIIGMLGGVRSEAPPPPPVVPDPEPEPEPPIVVEEEDDDNWSDL
jgi:hypothetical protein